ncbi:MAG TPA: VOC family protein [Candidatus Binatia bacterium]|nr:VOC family protein [Candidatus Binatia bacterium]
MAIQLNHIIVVCRDKKRSSTFLAEMLGLPRAKSFGPFLEVDTANGVSLAFLEHDGEVAPQHYAFLIGEDDFDAVFGRIRERGLEYWADPFLRRPGEINHNDGGRGVYFKDPDGHFLEVITRPYGSH